MATEKHSSNAVRRRHANGKHDTETDAKPVDQVGQNPLAIVRNDENYQDAAEKKPLKRDDGQAKTQVAGDKKQSGNELNGRIHDGNRRVAIAAFAAEQDPTEHRNIIVCLDCRTTLRATRPGQHNGHACRNPRDADVQEAANQEPEEEKRGNDHTFTLT